MDARPQLDPETISCLRDGVRIMALRALGSAEVAEDVAQETLARALTALESGRLSDPRKLPAFVHGIARHVIADVHRSRQRTASLTARFEAASTADSLDSLDHLIDQEELNGGWIVLEELSPRDREILRLSFFDGLTPTAIAKLQSVPPPTIRKQKSRALERLRRSFFGSGHAGGRSPTIHEEGGTIGIEGDKPEQSDRNDRGRSR